MNKVENLKSPRDRHMLEEKMTNCPKCNKPILNGGLFTSPARFNIRCPWCQSTLQINIQPRIITEVMKIGNGNGQMEKPEYMPAGLASLQNLPADFGSVSELSEARQPGQQVELQGKGFKVVGFLYPENDG